MSDKKLIAKNTLFLYFRMILVMCVSLYTSRVILQTLGAEDYGIYSVVGGIVVMFSFLSGSLAGATSRYLSFELGAGVYQNLLKTFSTSLNIYIAIGIIIVVLGEFAGLWLLYYKLTIPADRMYAAFWVLQFSILTTFISFTQYPFTAAIIAHENMSIYAYIGVYEAISKLLIAYAILISPIDTLIFYALLLMLNQICIQAFNISYAYRKYSECRFKLTKEKHLYKKLLSYSGYDLLPSMGSVVQDQGINILLNIFFGPIVNAARAITVHVNGAFNQLIINVLQAARPQVIMQYAKGNTDEMYYLTFLVAKSSYLLMLAIVMPMFLEMNYIIDLWLGESAPIQTVLFCKIGFLNVLIGSLSSSISMSMHAIGKLRNFSIINSILFLMPLPLGYLLFKLGFPEYSILLLSVAFNILIMVNILIQLYRIEKYNLELIFKDICIVCFVITVFSYVVLSFEQQHMTGGFLRLFILSFSSVLLIASYSWIFVLTTNQRKLIKSILLKTVR